MISKKDLLPAESTIPKMAVRGFKVGNTKIF